jgi:hypothetical protein
MFFAVKDNMKVLKGFLRKAKAVRIDNETEKKRLDKCKRIVGYIYKSPEAWDDRCAFNIKQNGSQFLQALRTFNRAKNTDIDSVHTISYRFLCEFNFFSG